MVLKLCLTDLHRDDWTIQSFYQCNIAIRTRWNDEYDRDTSDNILWVCICGIVEVSGCLDVMLKTVSKGIHSVGTLILITVICCLMLVFALE